MKRSAAISVLFFLAAAGTSQGDDMMTRVRSVQEQRQQQQRQDDQQDGVKATMLNAEPKVAFLNPKGNTEPNKVVHVTPAHVRLDAHKHDQADDDEDKVPTAKVTNAYVRSRAAKSRVKYDNAKVAAFYTPGGHPAIDKDKVVEVTAARFRLAVQDDEAQ